MAISRQREKEGAEAEGLAARISSILPGRSSNRPFSVLSEMAPKGACSRRGATLSRQFSSDVGLLSIAWIQYGYVDVLDVLEMIRASGILSISSRMAALLISSF